jgi:2-phosphoxylose phosphatase
MSKLYVEFKKSHAYVHATKHIQIHRHHKRTPYASNGFPVEPEPWDCPDAPPYSTGTTHWSFYTSPSNPFQIIGLHGTCLFPQITAGGLDDSRLHGEAIRSVYGDLLGFLPDLLNPTVSIRVTTNYITTQVATALLTALFPDDHSNIPLNVQPPLIDSLEPTYSCPNADSLMTSLQSSPTWISHLTASASLFAQLDAISGVSASDAGFHASADHYFDNLSTRQCHSRSLPCSVTKSSLCVTQSLADAIYRLGQWEYSFLYRGSEDAFHAAVVSYGAWLAELATNIRVAVQGGRLKYRHNVAHDGSLARLLGILQVDVMVWPGMGAEVVFEVYRRKHIDGPGRGNENTSGHYAVRVLWEGTTLRSSSQTLGEMDMLNLDVFLGYIDALVGVNGSKLLTLCGQG